MGTNPMPGTLTGRGNLEADNQGEGPVTTEDWSDVLTCQERLRTPRAQRG